MATQDIAWKIILEQFFPEFAEFFLEDLYKDIDFEKGFKFLDKEFAALFPDSAETNRIVDKLVSFHLKDYGEKLFLIHIEVQGQYVEKFPKRMFTYFYRIYDKYQMEVVALAIFTDNDPKQKPNSFDIEFYKTKLSYTYRTYKVIDQDDELLINSKNIFALAILAAKNVHKYGKYTDERNKFKEELFRLLLCRGYDKKYIVSFFNFIDQVVATPAEITKAIFNEIKEEGKLTMETQETVGSFAWSYFLEGRQEGELKGELKGKLEVAKALLKIGNSKELVLSVTGLTNEQIDNLISE